MLSNVKAITCSTAFTAIKEKKVRVATKDVFFTGR